MISNPIRPSAPVSGSRQPRSGTLAIKTENVLSHHESKQSLSALCSWSDSHHADRKFDFADLVLRPPLQKCLIARS
jgi:hypothetical protein